RQPGWTNPVQWLAPFGAVVRKLAYIFHCGIGPRKFLAAHPTDEASEVARLLAESIFPTVQPFVLGDDLIRGAAFRHAVGERHHRPLDHRATEAGQVCTRTILVEPPLGFGVVGFREPPTNRFLNG